MSIKTGPDDRWKFHERHELGETYVEIAQTTGVSVGCVRYWCRRLRAGESAVSQYHRPQPGLLSRFDPLVRYAVLRLRLEHPRWGPERIRYGLQQRPVLKRRRLKLPGVAQIGRYLRQWPKVRRRPHASHTEDQRPAPPSQVHQRWQVDFKLAIRLKNGTQVNLHTVRDPVGAACIAARVTPAGQAGHKPPRVTVRELQATLRSGFAYWHTLPQEVQTDHEPVFVGDTRDAFPGVFSLWLIGLGITHLTTRPGQPTDNAECERCHQTICNYAVIGNEDHDLDQLQQVLDGALEALNFDLPSRAEGCGGRPPAAAHPELLQPARLFALEHEWAEFDLKRVDAYLASRHWPRIVGKNGQVCIGGHHQYYSVGRTYAGQTVRVCFDDSDRHFVFRKNQEPYPEIRRRPARHLDVASLTGLVDPESNAVPQQLPLFSLQGVSC